MDILHLVDRLEELFNESRPIWFTHSVIVDEDRMLDLIDQMRVSIPEEIKKAQQLLANRDRLLAQAQEEASRTVQLARDKADHVVDRDPIVQAAQVRADQIVAQAHAEADLIRREADDYVQGSLSNLQLELERLMNQVQNGIKTLQAEKLQTQQSPKE
jgi:cell division septum initiation protein DivIVA